MCTSRQTAFEIKMHLLFYGDLKKSIFCHLNTVNYTENKLSSVRALHGRRGVGLVVQLDVFMHS